MPSKKRQHNIRLTDANEALLEQIRQHLRSITDIDVTTTEIFNAALVELGRRYFKPEEKPPRKPTRPKKA